MTARKAVGAALIAASLCCAVGAAYVAWGTAGALFVGAVGLYVAGYAIYTREETAQAVAYLARKQANEHHLN